MAKYKDEDAIIKALHNHRFITDVNGADWFDQIMNQVVDEIKNVPAADVVEVCRCEQCLKAYKHLNGRWCKVHQTMMRNVDYCSSGEKKDG